jgi:ACS family tartrate transporter-like MFS transporter
MINSIGNVAGYFAPQLVGVLRDMTGNYGLALIVVGAMAIVAAAILPIAGAPARAAQLRRAVAD